MTENRTFFGMQLNFWYANLMEVFERLAFFGVRAVTGLYLVKTANENGLGMGFNEKGTIYMVWALLQCLIPMVSGGYTERYGYRKSLMVAFVLNIVGYLGMAQSLPITEYLAGGDPSSAADYGFWVFLVAACFVGTGTAIFKPAVHGTIAKSTDEKTASMGWGIFYWVVNIGGALAPMCAAKLRGEFDWHLVFYAAAIVTCINFIPALFLYKEPKSTLSAEDLEKGPIEVFLESIMTLFKDLRFVLFLLIFSCFWLMFMQLWDLMPNFIDEWVDTTDVAKYFGWVSSDWVLGNGQVKPEMIININPMSVILLVLVVSWVIKKINKIAAMIIGMLISMVGFMGAGCTSVGAICCLMVLIFSIGEMTCSPTFSAYVGLIAPADKKALYMGYSNIPFAIGWALGNKIGGDLYESLGSKINLAKQYMCEHLNMTQEAVATIPKKDVLATMAEKMNGDMAQVTNVLWETYNPMQVWYYLGAIGLAGTLGMTIFYFSTKSQVAKSVDTEPEA